MDCQPLYICEICQTVLELRHGEAVCPNCGRTLDCGDLALLPANGLLDEEDQLVLRPGSDPGELIPRSPEAGQETHAPHRSLSPGGRGWGEGAGGEVAGRS